MSFSSAMLLLLRILAFCFLTLFLASLLSTLLMIAFVFVLNPSVDALYVIGWSVFVGSMLLAAMMVWRFLPIRRLGTTSEQEAHADP